MRIFRTYFSLIPGITPLGYPGGWAGNLESTYFPLPGWRHFGRLRGALIEKATSGSRSTQHNGNSLNRVGNPRTGAIGALDFALSERMKPSK